MGYLLFLFSIFSISLFCFFRNIYKLVLIIPGKKSLRKIMAISEIDKNKQDLFDYVDKIAKKLLEILSVYLEKYNLTFSEFEKQKLEHKLGRVGMKDETAARFRARQIVYPLLVMILGTIFSTLMSFIFKLSGIELPIIKVIFMLFSIVVAFYSIYMPSENLNKKIEIHNINVISEMPRFISTFRHAPIKNIVNIIKEYLRSGDSFLKYDFEQVVALVESGVSTDEALDEFSKNISIPVVTDTITVLKSSIKNKDVNDTNLQIIENRLLEKYEEYLNEEFEKRPPVLDLIIGTLVTSVFTIFAVPMGVYVIQQMLRTR